MIRRDFLRAAGAVSVYPAAYRFSVSNANWRTFEVTTRIEVLKPAGLTKIWVPMALLQERPFQKTISNEFHCEGGAVKRSEGSEKSLGIITAEFPAGVTRP